MLQLKNIARSVFRGVCVGVCYALLIKLYVYMFGAEPTCREIFTCAVVAGFIVGIIQGIIQVYRTKKN